MRLALAALALIAAPAMAQTAPAPAASAAPAVDPVALDLARQILDIASPPAKREEQINTLMKSLGARSLATVKQNYNFGGDPEMQKIFDNHMDRTFTAITSLTGKHMPAMFEGMARAYTKRFTIDELRQILAFAQSPAGTKYLQSGVEVAQDPEVIAVQQAMMNDMMKQMPALQADLEADIKAYQAKKGKTLRRKR